MVHQLPWGKAFRQGYREMSSKSLFQVLLKDQTTLITYCSLSEHPDAQEKKKCSQRISISRKKSKGKQQDKKKRNLKLLLYE